MLEQLQKDFAALNEPFAAFWRDAARQSQEAAQKASAELSQLAKDEMERAQALARAASPQEAFAALSQGFQARQAYVAQKTSEAFGQASAAAAQFQERSQEQLARASQGIEAAASASIAGAKQGLDWVESATKTLVQQASIAK